MIRRLAGISLGLGLAALLAIAVAARTIHREARGRTYGNLASVPHRRVGLVLGCSKQLSYGRRNLFFETRIRAAAELFRAGKVDYLIVSGDNHAREYDESSDMKDSLIRQGVPAARIYCDYAGFRTLDSVVRAREVFGQTEITIISQEFHNRRAIFIARHRGVDAIGFNAPEVDAYNSFRTRCREQAARVGTLLDVLVLRTQPRFLGPKVAIGESSPQAWPDSHACGRQPRKAISETRPGPALVAASPPAAPAWRTSRRQSARCASLPAI
jgi:SanA protein